MGLEVTATHVIWAFAAVVVVGGATSAFFESAEGLAEAGEARDGLVRERLATRVEGATFCYDGGSQRVNLTVHNVGTTRLVPSEVTLLLDGVARAPTASIPGAPGTDLWSPREVAYFTLDGISVEPERLMLATGEGITHHAVKLPCLYLATIVVSPASATLTAGATQDFTAQGYDQHGDLFDGIAFTWTTQAGSIASLGDESGRLTATIAGSSLTVTATYGGVSANATVTVHPAAPASVTVSPSPTSVTAGTTQQFTATVLDAYGNVNSTAPVAWSTTAGNVSASGLLTAQNTTTTGKSVTATSGSASGQALVDVVPGPVASVAISPTSATVLTQQTQQFTATGTDQYGNVVTNATFTWSATRGTVSTTGFYTAPSTTGADTVTATSNGVSASASVSVKKATHVQSLGTYDTGGAPATSFRKNTDVVTRIVVYDHNGLPVSGATVNIVMIDSDGVQRTNATGTTDATGLASITYRLPAKPLGGWVDRVTLLSGTDLTYDPTANVVTQVTFTLLN